MRCAHYRDTESIANPARPAKSIAQLVVIVFLIFVASVANAQDPPQYELTWIDNVLHPGESIRLKDLNEDGVVVGHAGGFESWGNYTLSWGRAVMFDRVNGMQNLNELEGVSWTDLETEETWPRNGIETPWIAARANGINEVNAFGEFQIVGTAIRRDHEPRAYVLTISINTSTDPEFKLLPRFGGVTNYGKAINDLGIAIGDGDGIIVFDPANNYQPVGIAVAPDGQEINNSGVIVTRGGDFSEGYVISPNPAGSFDYSNAFIDLQDALYGINDVGVVCGQRNRTGGRNKLAGGLVRFHYEYGQNGHLRTNDDLLTEDGGASYFCDVNNRGDVCFVGGWGRVYLDGNGFYNLEDHIAFDPNSQDEVEWLSTTIQPQGINDQRQIIIRTASSQRGALLTLITNDPIPGITVSPTNDLFTTEDGGTATFTVKLDTVPESPVIIDLSSSDEFLGTINGATNNVLTLEFTDDSSQTVTVTGVDDNLPIDDGPHPYTIITEAAVSTDPDYGGLDVDDVQVTNLDNDGPLVYSSDDTPLAIPDFPRAGIESTIPVADDFLIAGLTVTLNISHPRPDDLTVFLIGPNDLAVPLTNFSGDNPVLDFNGSGTFGPWTLEVVDHVKKKKGTLNGWSMTVDY